MLKSTLYFNMSSVSFKFQVLYKYSVSLKSHSLSKILKSLNCQILQNKKATHYLFQKIRADHSYNHIKINNKPNQTNEYKVQWGKRAWFQISSIYL